MGMLKGTTKARGAETGLRFVPEGSAWLACPRGRFCWALPPSQSRRAMPMLRRSPSTPLSSRATSASSRIRFAHIPAGPSGRLDAFQIDEGVKHCMPGLFRTSDRAFKAEGSSQRRRKSGNQSHCLRGVARGSRMTSLDPKSSRKERGTLSRPLSRRMCAPGRNLSAQRTV